jgi:hypothetical protein
VIRTHAPAATKQSYAFRPIRLSRIVTTGPNLEVTLDLLGLNPSPIPPRWQQLPRQAWYPIREFPPTGKLHMPRDGFARDSGFPFFRASGAATRGLLKAMRIQSSCVARLTRERDMLLRSWDEARPAWNYGLRACGTVRKSWAAKRRTSTSQSHATWWNDR